MCEKEYGRPPVKRLHLRKRWFAVVVAGAVALLTARDAMATDPREMKAREAFASQRYEEALDLFVKLYAETLHPIYQRNIGRCYQNMGQADHAITSFREYLRRGKNLPSREVKEIEGYIKELEELKRRQEASAATAPEPSSKDDTKPTEPKVAASAPVTPLPSASAAASTSPPPSTATATVALTPPPPPVEASAPFYTRWWFWTLVGGVAVAGLGVAFAAGAFTRTQDGTCPTDTICSPR